MTRSRHVSLFKQALITKRAKRTDIPITAIASIEDSLNMPHLDTKLSTVFAKGFHLSPDIHPGIRHATRPESALRAITQVLGPEADNYINLTPKRTLLHHVIANVITQIHTDHPTHFADIVAQCYKNCHLQPLNHQYTHVSQSSRSQAERTHREKSDADEILRFIVQTCQKRETAGAYNAHHLTLSVDEIITMVYGDYLTKKNMAVHFHETVQTQLNKMLRGGEIKKLETFAPRERITYMISGAPATGKGVLTGYLMQMGVKLDKLCRILPDEWHAILQQNSDPNDLGPDKRYHGKLLHTETVAVRKLIMANLTQNITQGLPIPNCIMEMIIATPERINFATMNGGRLRCFVAAHDNPLSAMQGCITRFNNTGRFVQVKDIVLSLQDLSREMPNTMQHIISQPTDARIEIYDMTHIHASHTTAHDTPKSPICTGDSLNGKMLIFNIEDFLHFCKKIYLDRETKNPHELYVKHAKLNTKALAQSFKAHYQSMLGNIILIDPTVNLTKNQHKLYEYAYAHFSNTGELIIDNDARYKRILKQSEVARTFFEAFQENINIKQRPGRSS
ncbi:MAG: hypothetical protein A3F43_00200 [Gammaproteobacteria bacterium RIFCSPHIGHO2_12_FULL_42_10]|nr:MAG: hypothetical protein A3F43_00200 [Gammaproteobacteria bacterium RIFCSPHIGHO2_12_FULL_42_10]